MSFFVFYFSYLYVSCSGFITSVGEERELICLLLFLFGEVSSSSGYLGWAAAYFIVALPGPFLSSF